MTSAPFPRLSWLLPWVLLYLIESPLIWYRWGFGDWDGGRLGYVLPLMLYLALGAVLWGLTLLVAKLVRRPERGPDWAHLMAWLAVGALSAGLWFHALIFDERLNAPGLGFVSATCGALVGAACYFVVHGALLSWSPLSRLLLVLLLGMLLPQPIDDILRLQSKRQAYQPNLLLITIDTCATEHLTPYAKTLQANPTTPFLARFAQESQQFERVYTPIGLTGPSHATIMSGLHPLELGLTDNHLPMPLNVETIAESLRAQGYHTNGVPGNMMVRSRYNFQQGFDRYPQAAGQHDLQSLQWEYLFPWRFGRVLFGKQWTLSRFTPDAKVQTDTALRLLGPTPATRKPWFCWVHYFDAHAPYEPQPGYEPAGLTSDPASLAELCSHEGHYDVSYDALAELFGHRDLAQRGISPLVATPAEIEDVRAEYDAQLRYIDAQIDRLITHLEKQKQLRDTVVIITADHGEGLYEHGYFGHSYYPYKTELHVPLLIHTGNSVHGYDPDILLSTEDLYSGLDVLGFHLQPNAQRVNRGSPLALSAHAGGKPVHFNSQEPILILRGDAWRGMLTPGNQKAVYMATVGETQYGARFWKGPAWLLLNLNDELLEATERLYADPSSGYVRQLQGRLTELVRSYEGVGPADVNYLGYASIGKSRAELAEMQGLGYLMGGSGGTDPGIAPTPRYTAGAAAPQSMQPAQASPR